MRTLFSSLLVLGFFFFLSCDTTDPRNLTALQEMIENNDFFYHHPEADSAYGRVAFDDMYTTADVAFHPFPCGSDATNSATYDYRVIGDEYLIIEDDTSEVITFDDTSFQLKVTGEQEETDTLVFHAECESLN